MNAQDLYDINTIQKIEITFSQANWDYILDTAKAGSDSYLMALEVKINGISYDSVGVKYKGNSSYNATRVKNPLHIEMDHFADRYYLGYKDIKLSNGYNEPTNIREALLYGMLQNYTWASKANFAQVYINDTLKGLYTNVEAVSKTFLKDRFGSKKYTFVFADLGGCDLVYRGTDTTLYYTPYTMKSDYGWTDLMNLCGTLDYNMPSIENILDVDRALWMHAFNNLTVTLDSYAGNGKHNYYIYEDKNGRFNPIHWDLNGGLGIFARPYTGPSWTVTQLENMTPTLHMAAADTAWPLIYKLLNTPLFYRMYFAHMRTILNENFANNSYYTTAQNLQAIIDTAVQSDFNQFFTYTQYQANLTTNVTVGTRTYPGITSLMSNRMNYLNTTPELQQIPPVIISIGVSDPTPPLNSTFFLTAEVSNANAVYLGTRNDWEDRFIRIPMYDDGLNGDGAAGDGVYGAVVIMDYTVKQYFIYADNPNAGVFSPERAEHEYYTILSQEDAPHIDILIFPDPVADYFSISVPDTTCSVQVFDMLGRILIDEKILTNEHKIYVTLANGIYCYRVNKGEGIAAKGFFRVLKQ